MKISKIIGGVIILTLLFSSYSEQGPLTVLCSLDWFMVTIYPMMLNNDVYIHFHELHMGNGCPPNYVQPHVYQFTYRVSQCGIKAKILSHNVILFRTELHYISKGTSTRLVIPLSCTAPLKFPKSSSPQALPGLSDLGATARVGDEYKVFTLSQCREIPHCDCPPFVVHGGVTQAQVYQAEAEEDNPAPYSSLVDVNGEWTLHSDDLLGPM